MTKAYEEELKDLNNGLDSLNKAITNPKNCILHSKVLKNRDIQEARIDFFKRGYMFRDREIKAQQTLKIEAKK